MTDLLSHNGTKIYPMTNRSEIRIIAAEKFLKRPLDKTRERFELKPLAEGVERTL